jgi:hypothetical protein
VYEAEDPADRVGERRGPQKLCTTHWLPSSADGDAVETAARTSAAVGVGVLEKHGTGARTGGAGA